MIPVTVDSIRRIYTLLRAFPPFSRWHLPAASKIRFKVTRHTDCFGQYEADPHTISISKPKIGYLESLEKTIAHEMVHLYLEQRGRSDHAAHDAHFLARAAQVCQVFGWDPKEF